MSGYVEPLTSTEVRKGEPVIVVRKAGGFAIVMSLIVGACVWSGSNLPLGIAASVTYVTLFWQLRSIHFYLSQLHRR